MKQASQAEIKGPSLAQQFDLPIFLDANAKRLVVQDMVVIFAMVAVAIV